MIASTKPALLRQSVRNLWITTRLNSDIKHHLAAFPALENLFIFENELTPHCATMRMTALRQLHCCFADFVGLIPLGPPWPNITHLELFDSLEDPELERVTSSLTRLPQLTHLALNHTSEIPFCLRLLDICRSLTALTILARVPEPQPLELETLANDPRFVMMTLDAYAADWQHGTLTGRDYWTRVDAFIAKRISGEIDRE
jgi:hypothetical protein